MKRIPFPLLVFLIALALRLVPVFMARGLGIGLDDMFQYDMLARSIVAGNGYRWYAQHDLGLVQSYFSTLNFQIPADYDPRGVLTSFRPPLYPAFLALIYFFTGVDDNRFFTARIVQAFVSALLVPLTYFLARKLFPEREKLARLAAWALAFYPLMVLYPLSLATENLFFVLVTGALLTLLIAEETRRLRYFLLAGVLIGLSALTRSVFLAFGGLAVLWAFFILKERKKAALMFLAVVVCVLPWMVRNTLLHGRPTGIESALGYDLYVGYHPQSSGTFQVGISLHLLPYLDDGVRDQIGQAKAMQFIREEPGRIPYLMLRRLGYFFGLERRALTYFYSNNFFGFIPLPALLGIAFVILVPFVVVSASAMLGVAISPWDKRFQLIYLFLFGYIFPHLLILGEDRFHLTLVPVLVIFAALAWTGGFRAFSAHWQGGYMGKIVISLALLAIVLLFFNWGMELSSDAHKLLVLLGPAGNRSYFPY